MNYNTLILKKEDGVATITLNRPERLNAMNLEMSKEFIQARGELCEDKGIGAIIITGAGRGFCSGADISAEDFQVIDPSDVAKLLEPARRCIMGIREIPKPVIAAVNGPVVGGGCCLALACDIIIASKKARFGLSFVLRGLHPDFGGTYFLPRMIGVAKANDLIYTGRIIDADEADRIGMISRVVPADKLESVTREIAVTLAKGASQAISMTKASINKVLQMDLTAALEYEARAQSILMMSEDFRESTAAFLEKREPVFRGK
jgi:2-(1,2-epoxy-1,2-dihydrophenyl)acetyl-CoA isomerase